MAIPCDPPKAEITLTQGPIYQDAEIIVGGVDISKMVSAVRVEAIVGHPARAVITIPFGVLARLGAIETVLCEETANALHSLGWTGPEDEDTTAPCHAASASS